jgi:hypothetical protein
MYFSGGEIAVDLGWDPSLPVDMAKVFEKLGLGLDFPLGWVWRVVPN